MRSMIILCSVCLLAACVPPPGSYKPELVDWKQEDIPGGVIEVNKNIYQGFRSCQKIGFANWMVDPRGTEAHADVMCGTGFGGVPPWTIGFIDLQPNGDAKATTMKVGIVKDIVEGSGKKLRVLVQMGER